MNGNQQISGSSLNSRSFEPIARWGGTADEWLNLTQHHTFSFTHPPGTGLANDADLRPSNAQQQGSSTGLDVDRWENKEAPGRIYPSFNLGPNLPPFLQRRLAVQRGSLPNSGNTSPSLTPTFSYSPLADDIYQRTGPINGTNERFYPNQRLGNQQGQIPATFGSAMPLNTPAFVHYDQRSDYIPQWTPPNDGNFLTNPPHQFGGSISNHPQFGFVDASSTRGMNPPFLPPPEQMWNAPLVEAPHSNLYYDGGYNRAAVSPVPDPLSRPRRDIIPPREATPAPSVAAPPSFYPPLQWVPQSHDDIMGIKQTAPPSNPRAKRGRSDDVEPTGDDVLLQEISVDQWKQLRQQYPSLEGTMRSTVQSLANFAATRKVRLQDVIPRRVCEGDTAVCCWTVEKEVDGIVVECPCGKQIRLQRSDMSDHLATHFPNNTLPDSGVRCQWGACPSETMMGGSLGKHVVTSHCKKLAVECPGCKKIYNQISVLLRHYGTCPWFPSAPETQLDQQGNEIPVRVKRRKVEK